MSFLESYSWKKMDTFFKGLNIFLSIISLLHIIFYCKIIRIYSIYWWKIGLYNIDTHYASKSFQSYKYFQICIKKKNNNKMWNIFWRYEKREIICHTLCRIFLKELDEATKCILENEWKSLTINRYIYNFFLSSKIIFYITIYG